MKSSNRWSGEFFLRWSMVVLCCLMLNIGAPSCPDPEALEGGDDPGSTAEVTPAPYSPINLVLVHSQPIVHSGLMVAGLVDDDAYPDVLTEFDYGTVSYLRGNGDGTLQTQKTWKVCKDCRGVNYGDFNEDGHNDLVVIDWGNDLIKLQFGNGYGTFLPPVSMPGEGAFRWVGVNDLDGDGHLDLLADSPKNDAVVILMGLGDGTFAAPVYVPVGVTPRIHELADLNNDCIPDLVVSNWDDGGGVSVLLGTGPGTFGDPVIYPIPGPVADANVGDFNDDGCLDVVATSYGDGTVRWWRGDCAGNLTWAEDYQVGSRSHAVAVADFNCDGFDDFVTVSRSQNFISVFAGRGDTFEQGQLAGAGNDPFDLDVDDFDLDGLPDLVSLDRTSTSYARIYLNRTEIGSCDPAARDNLCMAPPVPPEPDARACITHPVPGQKFDGNLLLVKAEICEGDPALVAAVRFQWRAGTASSWTDVPFTKKESNPDPGAPYGLHWDVTELPPGDYELRAVTYNLDLMADPNPPVSAFYVDKLK